MNEIQDRASSILSLNLQWKDIECVLDSAQSIIEERIKEVNSKEDEVQEHANKLRKEIERKEKLVKDKFEELRIKEEDLGRQFRDLELGRKCYEERLRGVELKQKELEELKLKEEEFGLKEKVFEKLCGDFELEKKDLQRRCKDLELGEKQCEEQRKEVNLMEKLVNDKLEEVGLKEKDLEKRLREYELKEEQFGLKEKSFGKRCMEFELEKKAFKERCRDLEFNNKQYEHERKRLEVTEKWVQKQLEEIKGKEEEFEERCKHVELKEKGLELRECELEENKKHCDEYLRKVKLREEIEELSAEQRRKYEQQSNHFELNVKRCKQRFKDLESKEKKVAEWSKQQETIRGLASALHPQVKTEAASILLVKYSVDHSSRAHLQFCINMDGKDLQMFLNEHWKQHGSIGTEVSMALQLSADPAKLVLDAMEGFYPPHLTKGDRKFEGKAARRSCILLLEKLMELSPEIKPHVKDKAMKLAFDWVTKMRIESGHELEVLGFLWLLASFQLAYAFDADELLNFSVFVAQLIENTKIFKALGLGDKITRFKIKTGSGPTKGKPHKRQRDLIATDAPLAATNTVSSRKMTSKDLTGSKQGKHFFTMLLAGLPISSTTSSLTLEEQTLVQTLLIIINILISSSSKMQILFGWLSPYRSAYKPQVTYYYHYWEAVAGPDDEDEAGS
ncbi:hypothetical protein V6N13_037562 [Hibiscus sabdariffa]|uniref:FRIGIDA-like protein n=1 Tax=Hibiscus sabdariffa TaxID=183260 RepID=A0ABR2S4T4_9ROSI